MIQARKFTFPETMWAGTNSSLDIARDFHESLMAGMFDAVPADTQQQDVPHNFSMQGSIGVIKISGSLVNNDSPYNQYRGLTSYNDIRKAMVYAANQEGVKAILLDINSGGGAVSGVADAGNLISSIDKNVKPVYAYTDGTMASAAYWLGVSTRGVYASQTSMIGSIGVIATHEEYSKALKDAGIGAKVMRSGEFKALLNSMEPMTAVAAEQLQGQLDQAYGVFATHVADKLGVSMPVFESTMGQGREFFGQSAVTSGLAKSVQTYDSMIGMIDKKLIDSSAKKGNTAMNPQRGLNMARETLTEQQIAALAAGAGNVVPDAAALALAATEAAALAAAAAAAEVAAAALVAAAAVVAPAASSTDGVVAYLQGQVKEKDVAALASAVELSGLKAKLASVEATHTGLVKIAASSLSNMKIGMGMARVDFSAMTPELLLAEHASTVDTFTKAFKVGGVAALNTPDPKIETGKAPDELKAARIAATRFSNK